MGFFEALGEATVRFANRAVYHLAGLLIKIIQLARELDARFGNRINFYPYFEERGVEAKDYLVLKIQICALAFLLFSVLYIFRFVSFKFFFLAALAAGGYAAYLLFSTVRSYFAEDFAAYRDFFMSYLSASALLVLINYKKPVLGFSFPYLHLVLFSLAYIVAFSYFFRKKYGREYTFGRVIESNGLLKVKVNYDIRASVKPGIHVFENKLNAKKGDIVKLRVEKGFFNLRGNRVIAVEEVVKDA